LVVGGPIDFPPGAKKESRWVMSYSKYEKLTVESNGPPAQLNLMKAAIKLTPAKDPSEATWTVSLKPYEDSIRRLVLLQERIEVFDGNDVIGIWYPASTASFCFVKKVENQPPRKLLTDFSKDRAGWQIYDYNGGKAGGGNVFFPATWEKSGGVGDSGYIWGDDSRWRIDTPEDPHSILAFIIYRSWVGGQALDLRGAKVSVHLRGDKLDLRGGKCLFWALNNANGTRWHMKGAPLAISEGKWGAKQTIVLKNDEKLWHNSWSRHPDKPASLDEVLGTCDSYGFSFVGFSGEATGKFSMDELEIEFAENKKR
jgi:hypothetical protein